MTDPISTSLAAPLVKKLSEGIAEAAKGSLAKKKDELKLRLGLGFSGYTQQQISRYKSVKTIIGSAVPLQFEDIYVNLYLEQAKLKGKKNEKRIRDEDFIKLAPKDKRIIFTATAGAGKSMLMRYLFFLFLSQQDSVWPVFVELRDINDSPESTIIDFIKERIQEHISGFTADMLKYAFKKGLIALFLDGYDEIDYDKRAKRSREINFLAGRYPESIIVVSSRHDNLFLGWDRFNWYQVAEFSERQVKLLIEKIPYDDDIKQLFLKKLGDGLYKTHKEFLANPLLTLMMLITLEQFAEIPAKIHLFYEYSFEALFAKHDAAKSGGFVRKRHVSLALDDYRRLFSYFCTITYIREQFRFTESNALEMLNNSINASQISANKSEMLEDLVACTCMLARDGLDYVFNHRSFQEYFVAYFFMRVKPEEFAKATSKLIARGGIDNVFLMMSEMNTELFEETWALPQLNKMCASVADTDPKHNPVTYLMKLINDSGVTIILSKGEGVPGTERPMLQIITSPGDGSTLPQSRSIMYNIYNIYARIKKKARSTGFDESELYQSIMDRKLLANDKRFDDFRKQGNVGDIFGIDATETDDTWMVGSDFANFVVAEKEELFRLRSEIRERVEKRKKGLASILEF